MKTSIIAISLMFHLVLLGCYYPSRESVGVLNKEEIEKALEVIPVAEQRIENLNKELSSINNSQREIYSELTDTQLSATNDFIVAIKTLDDLQVEMAARAMKSTMTDEQFNQIAVSLSKGYELRGKIQKYETIIADLTRLIEKSRRYAEKRRVANRQAIQAAAQGFNNSLMLDQQLKGNDSQIFYPQNNNNNSTYWQEQNARREYFENALPKSNIIIP